MDCAGKGEAAASRRKAWLTECRGICFAPLCHRCRLSNIKRMRPQNHASRNSCRLRVRHPLQQTGEAAWPVALGQAPCICLRIGPTHWHPFNFALHCDGLTSDEGQSLTTTAAGTQQPSGVVTQDASSASSCPLHQPCCEVDAVTQHGILSPSGTADDTGEHTAGCNTDAADVTALPQRSRHLQGAEHRTGGSGMR